MWSGLTGLENLVIRALEFKLGNQGCSKIVKIIMT